MAGRGRNGLTTKLCRTTRTYHRLLSDTFGGQLANMMTERGMILFLFTLLAVCWAGLV